ncbi:PH domain-containing protein [Lapillicoccus sp.]|uniref:PH domain-containing protein n=1 Tax=Lapillicoccus sp. TaxID=1909287 RepID=UPI00398312FD
MTEPQPHAGLPPAGLPPAHLQDTGPVQQPPPGSGLRSVETHWRRLNVRMLLIHPVQEGLRFLPALAGVFILGRTQDRGGGGWWELVALAAVVALGFLRYFTTRFRIENGQIELRKGLFTKQVIATPADRVRTVDVTAPLFHRILGLAKVEIGTAAGGQERLVLDALTVKEARRLREELIHRRSLAAAEPGAGPPAVGGSDPGAPLPPPTNPETTLLGLDPGWVRFAPLTTSGLLSALAILGFANQYLQRYLEQSDLGNTFNRLGGYPVWVDVLVGLVGVAAAVSVLAVLGYLLQFWGFRLTRHRGGTLHVTRGLVTSRETSIEEKRIRGVEIGEPLGLRLGGGGRLMAITTGLSKKEQDRGSAWLVPPAPRAVVTGVAAAIIGDDEALSAPLRQHGPAALRRRYARAIGPALLLAVGVVVLTVRFEGPLWVGVVGCLPLLVSPLVARDRYAGLGHRLTGRHLVVRSGTFVRRRDVLLRQGIIGFNLRQTFFQRRVGLATLAATTAAGKQSYTAYDIPLGEAVAVAHGVDPQLLGQFLAS